jgi:hypothetical protein
MRRVFVIQGLKRSGNHAVINWLQAHRSAFFFNNIIPAAPILRGERAIPEPEDFRRWFRRELRRRHRAVDYLAARLTLWRHDLMVSLEDLDVRVRPFLDVPYELVNVLVVRDPYNLFASRIRKASLVDHPAYPGRPGPAMDRVVDQWKIHAREFLGMTSHLENRVGVYFDAWFADPGYRRDLCRRLDLSFTDKGFSTVSRTGGGSSFDSTSYDGANQSMAVLDRRRDLTDAERQVFEQVVADGELRDLAKRIEAGAGRM